MFDGDASDLDDWREAIDQPEGVWKVVDGILVHEDSGKGNHLFYDGPEGPWGDLELVCEFRTEVGTNSGVYFRSQYQDKDFPDAPYDLEAQINNSSSTTLSRRTGNLIPDGDPSCDDNVFLDGERVCSSPTVDNEWTHMRVIARTVGDKIHVTIAVNGSIITHDTDGVDAAVYPDTGTICPQGEGLGPRHDRVKFRGVFVRHLPVTSCDGWDQGSQSSTAPPMRLLSH